MEEYIIQEYKELFLKETCQLFWEHFEGQKKFTEPVFLALLSVILTIVGLFVVNGAVSMNDISIAIIPTFGVPLLWAAIVWFRSRAKAHVNIYKNLNEKFDKYDWGRVAFSIVPFDILGLEGHALEIRNNKSIPLENLSVWYVGNRSGQDKEVLEVKERIGFINHKEEIIQFQSGILASGKRLLFAITAKETNLGDGLFYIRSEIMRRPTALLGLDFAMDIIIMAKTVVNFDLPIKRLRLSIDLDGLVTKRENYD